MYRFAKVLAISLFSILLLVPVAFAQRGFRGGFRGGWGGWGGAYLGPGWGWYAPYGYWGYPYAYSYWGYPYDYAPIARPGDVKIENAAKDDSVYIDGGYSGTVNQLKKFQLRPGTHTIEVRDRAGHTVDKEQVQILSGKTLEIHANQGGH
jgi:hypothetical protein